MVSFRREVFVPKGGPSGGDGGKGGSVIFVATPDEDTLYSFRGKTHWHAQNGQNGGSKQCYGSDGEDLIIRVPVGTMIYDDETGELMSDLAEPHQSAVIAKGGKGGFGNEHFKSPTNQAPRDFTPGEPAEFFHLRLELKLIADVGLVGKPNAGKSTLLSAVSAARPKIADYPFTTLTPQLGIAELTDHRRLVLADIPGLIAGASGGAGLGHNFLRHIERTRIIVHVLEVEPLDESDPIENYRIIRRELNQYSPELASKPEILALNKMDLMGGEADQQAAIQLFEAELGIKAVPISAVSGQGTAKLLELAWQMLRTIDQTQAMA